MRTDVSTETVSEHLLRKNLDGCRGKVFKDVIIASASSKRIFSNPKLTRDLLVYGGFSAFIENGFEVKGRGSSVRISIDASSDIDLSAIKRLNDHDVHCWSPLSSDHSIGVISPIDTNMNLVRDFFPNAQLLGNDSARSSIVDGKRLKKRGKELALVKLVFNGPLPEKIVWNH